MARHARRVSAIPRLLLGGRDWTLAALLVAGVAISLLVMKASGGAHPFPEDIVRAFPMVEWVNQAEKWLQEHFRWLTRGISEAVGWALENLEVFLLLQPWPVLVIVLVLPALAYGGLRLGLFTFFGVMFWGAVGHVGRGDLDSEPDGRIGAALRRDRGPCWASPARRTTASRRCCAPSSTRCRSCPHSSTWCPRSSSSASAGPPRRWRSSSTPSPR